MTSFQAQIGWKMQRKRENKTVIPFRSVPTRREIENSKKIVKKLKYTIMASFQAKIGLIKAEKEKK